MEKYLVMEPYKRFFRFFVVAFVFIAALSVPLPKIHAADLPSPLCAPDENLFEKIKSAFTTLDIRRTTVNMFNSMVLDVTTHAAFNRSIKDISECYIWEIKTLQTESDLPPDAQVDTFVAEAEAEGCDMDPDVDCSDLGETYKIAPPNPTGSNGQFPGFANNTTSGSLLGMANLLQGAVNEPVPVNLAYWWNDNVARIPFAGKALAAEVTYGGPLVEFVFDFWKYTRNLAYALLAVVLLIVGFMIMARKKINPQMAVTAQTALPRIVLAVIFITFSYPIGALAASAAWSLGQYAAFIAMDSLVPWTTNATIGEFTIGYALVLMIGTLLAVSGIGIVLILAVFIAAIVVIILFIVCLIKALAAYIRILFSIIAAPLAFAVGAIPGQEATTTKWFKSLAADVMTIPAIFFVISLTIGLLIRTALAGPIEGAWTSTIVIILLGPFIAIYGFSLAAKMPKLVKNWIVGEEKPRR